jgi:hypothetical protein
MDHASTNARRSARGGIGIPMWILGAGLSLEEEERRGVGFTVALPNRVWDRKSSARVILYHNRDAPKTVPRRFTFNRLVVWPRDEGSRG